MRHRSNYMTPEGCPFVSTLFIKWSIFSLLIVVSTCNIHSLQFSRSVMSNSLWPYGLQHARIPSPSPTPGACQTHIHRVGDAIQPSHPPSSPSPPAFNLSQHQCLLQWVSSLHQVAKELEFQLQHQSFQWIFRADFLQNRLVGSPCSPRDSQESSPILQFKGINSLVLSFLYSANMWSRLVITFLPRSKHLLISWL